MTSLMGEAIVDQGQPAVGDNGPGQATPATNQANPLRLTVEAGAEQHLLQVWTMPRKRVVFDHNPTTDDISTKFTLYNRSEEAYTFKVKSASDLAYTASPSAGLVNPGQSVEVSIVLNASKCHDRVIEKDTFTIDLAGNDADQNSANNFEFHDKRVLFVGVSTSAKDRLAYVVAEEQKALVARTQRYRRNVKIAIGVVCLLALLFFLICTDVCDCQD